MGSWVSASPASGAPPNIVRSRSVPGRLGKPAKKGQIGRELAAAGRGQRAMEDRRPNGQWSVGLPNISQFGAERILP